MDRCAAIKPNGERCKVDAMPDSDRCWSHDERMAEERRRRASKGGRRGGRGRPQVELSDIKDRIRAMVEDVRNGTMDRADASVCGQLYNTLIRAVSVEVRVREVEELAKEVEELRDLLESRKESRAWG